MLLQTRTPLDAAAPDVVDSPRSVRTSFPGLARRISSARLLEGSRELVIEHQGHEYHLRVTRNDKLILTK